MEGRGKLSTLQFIHGDCRKAVVGLPKAKLVLADPPYNFDLNYGDHYDDALPWHQYRDLLHQWILAGQYAMAPGGVMAWINAARNYAMQWDMLAGADGENGWAWPIVLHERFSQYQTKHLTMDWRCLHLWARAKPTMASAAHRPHDCLESIREKSQRLEAGDKRADPRGRLPGSVWRVRRLQGTSNDRHGEHPAQIAPELWRKLVLMWTEPGDLVVDLFAGVGGSGEVCRALGRDWIGIELGERWVKEGRERLGLDETPAKAGSCGLHGTRDNAAMAESVPGHGFDSEPHSGDSPCTDSEPSAA